MSTSENTETDTETVTAEQGSQPTIAGLRIGIIDAATRDGVSKARLLLRPASGDRAVTVTVGESIELSDGVTAALDAVDPGAGSRGRPTVTITVSQKPSE
ncbi:hypothetical protein [Agreia sp. VKM Ac-1783]|uniref:hypothetical protein n=1 Tax=Agreia sp. VKM Ac-1783 TaxID=1938889 RepID=UPI000A2AAA38|nr:hypothetical protein [Agreia sp. VKM Ac-1783]SMQ75378.1 hypothetical protein SAMN06295943_3514 [Agreia sp. VKM Ac-1783]